MQVPTNMLGCDLEGEASSDSQVTKLALSVEKQPEP